MNDQTAKADAGKLELDLVPAEILRCIAEVRMYGNRKYGSADNWKQVELRRYVNALLRHTLAFAEDHGSVDEESGIPHYKHMACNMAFLCEMMRRQELAEAAGAEAARKSQHMEIVEKMAAGPDWQAFKRAAQDDGK